MSAKHTAGPWEIHGKGISSFLTDQIRKIRPNVIGISTPLPPFAFGEATIFCIGNKAEENARLIAAAPDMLEALKLAEKYVQGIDSQQAFTSPENRVTYKDLQQIRAAILKAEPQP